MWVKRVLVVGLLVATGATGAMGCENKFRAQRAPADQSLPQPDRGPCSKDPPPVLYVRLPRFVREDVRDKRYCSPLNKVFEEQKLGTVSAVAPAPRADAGHAGCAVHATDVDSALTLLLGELAKLKMPERTVIEELCTGVGSVHRVP